MRNIHESTNPIRDELGARMKVICAGLPRCATSSLQEALEKHLSHHPCMHMAHIAPNAEREKLVISAMEEPNREKRHKILHQIFDGFEATADFPGYWFIDDLKDMYPDAPLILNQRSGGGSSWFKSFNEALGFFTTLQYYIICFPQQTDRLHWRIHHVAKGQMIRKWGCHFEDGFYDSYNDFVLKEAKKRGRDVLVWKAEDGWEPICKLLDKPVPDVKFPWVNDKATMSTLKKILVARGIISWLAIGGGLYATWKYGPGLLGKLPWVLKSLKK